MVKYKTLYEIKPKELDVDFTLLIYMHHAFQKEPTTSGTKEQREYAMSRLNNQPRKTKPEITSRLTNYYRDSKLIRLLRELITVIT